MRTVGAVAHGEVAAEDVDGQAGFNLAVDLATSAVLCQV